MLSQQLIFYVNKKYSHKLIKKKTYPKIKMGKEQKEIIYKARLQLVRKEKKNQRNAK